MKKSKVLALFLSLLLVIAPFSSALVSVEAAEGAIWTFDNTTGTLTISGDGGTGTFSYNAPSGCTVDNFKHLIIEDGITNISVEAFMDCTNLETVDIGDDVTVIGSFAFALCSGITRVTIGTSVTNIAQYAFAACEALTSIEIPNSVTEIGYQAFKGCKKLENITLPDSITTIYPEVFDKTAYYDNPDNWIDGILYIGKYLIKANEDIKGDVEIKDGTLAIADKAFYCCRNITSVTIPTGVRSIGFNAFAGCVSLINVTIPDSVTNIGSSAFYCCEALKEVQLSSSLEKIDDYTFMYCSKLEKIIIPESVKSIGSYAFYGCSVLESVTIPDTVTSINDFAFTDCDSLSTIVCYRNSTAHTFAQSKGIDCKFLERQTDEDTGVSVSFEEDGTFDGEAKLNVEIKPSDSVTLPENYEKTSVFDIGFTVDDVEAAPKKELSVKIPVPTDFNSENLKVFTENENGELEETEISYYNGFIYIRTSTLGTVVIADTTPKAPEKEKSTLQLIMELIIAIMELLYVFYINFSKL